MSLYNSFYGGRRGASFIIVKNYATVSGMLDDFQQGDQCTVNYEEYVLINTQHKNNIENGRVYRRGYDINSGRKIEDGAGNLVDAYGAEYIGTIVGPAGKSPKVSVLQFSNVPDISTDSPPYYDVNKEIGTVDMIPGKSGNVYNDNILYKAVSWREEGADDTTLILGFKVPYLVTDWEVSKGESPYDLPSVEKIVGQNEHPFYNKFHLTLPPGLKGDGYQNLQIVNLRTWKTSHPNATIIDASTGNTYTENISKLVVLCEKVVNNYAQNENDREEISYYYLSDFRTIQSISLNPTSGRLMIAYSDASGSFVEIPYVSALTYYTTLESGKQGQITYSIKNGSEQTLINNFKVIQEVGIIEEEGADKGKLAVKYNYGAPDIITDEKFVALENFNVDQENGTLSYKTNEMQNSSTYTIPFVDGMTYNSETAAVSYTKNGQQNPNLLGVLPCVKGYYISQDEKDFFIQFTSTECIPDNLPPYSGNAMPSEGHWAYLGNLKYVQSPLIAYNYTYSELASALQGVGQYPDNYDETKVDGVPFSQWPSGVNKYSVIIQSLNILHGSGLTTDYEAQTITVGNADQQKDFYAYNYRQSTWYFLGTLESSSVEIGNGSSSAANIVLTTPDEDQICSIEIVIDNNLQSVVSYTNPMQHIKYGAVYKNKFTKTGNLPWSFVFIQNGTTIGNPNAHTGWYWNPSTGEFQGTLTNDLRIQIRTTGG